MAKKITAPKKPKPTAAAAKAKPAAGATKKKLKIRELTEEEVGEVAGGQVRAAFQRSAE